jgi:hypothetical protein
MDDDDKKMLRHVYAAVAMHGYLMRAPAGQLPAPNLIADQAYEIADAMIAKVKVDAA